MLLDAAIVVRDQWHWKLEVAMESRVVDGGLWPAKAFDVIGHDYVGGSPSELSVPWNIATLSLKFLLITNTARRFFFIFFIHQSLFATC